MTHSETFDRSKIYEKLEYQPEPAGYDGKIPWVIQQQIAATNGIHYANSVGKLQEIPIPPIPIPAAQRQGKLCLDIGCGWGRWLVAIGRKGYIPLGIDIRHEFCVSARETLQLHQLHGYTVVADLKNLPFQDGVLDAVWSFSVIQHTHCERLQHCIAHIYRILNKNGFCFLEFPNKYGMRNFFGPVKEAKTREMDYNSWAVRYYSIAEYKAFFEAKFNNFKAIVHSMLGIGVLPNDLQYTNGWKNRLQIALSLLATQVAKIIPPLVQIADSIYVYCTKREENNNELADSAVQAFWQAHQTNPQNNLNILPLLRCPASGGALRLEGNELISDAAKLTYPVLDGVPILIVAEGRGIN
jgi:hypothetical protein